MEICLVKWRGISVPGLSKGESMSYQEAQYAKIGITRSINGVETEGDYSHIYKL